MPRAQGRQYSTAEMDPEAKENLRLQKEEAATAFFASLPQDSFTSEEEGLRDALIAGMGETGNVRLSIAAQRNEVRMAKTALGFPPGVVLTQWLTQRLADDFTLVPDPNTGERILCVAGTEHEVEASGDVREDFYASLPLDAFTADEAVLRDLLLAMIHRHGGPSVKLSQLTRGDKSNELHAAKVGVLPKGAPFNEWVMRRLGSEVAVTTEGAGGHVVELLPEGKAAAAQAARKYFAGSGGSGGGKGAAAAGKGGGKGKDVTPRGANATPLRPRAPNLPPPGQKGGGARAAFQPVDDEAHKEQLRVEKEERITAFFHNLPTDALTNEEQGLREALLVAIDQLGGDVGGKTVRFSLMCSNPIVKDAKMATLPAEVTVATWIEARVGSEIILSKDPSHGQVMAERAFDAEPEPELAADHGDDQGMQVSHKSQEERKAEKEAQVVAFFEGRPLSHIERSLKARLVEAVASKGGGEAQRLSACLNIDAGVMESWKQVKASWAQENIRVPFESWVELRMADQLRILREPYVSLTKPELERRGLATRREGKGKRGAEEAFGRNPYMVPGQGPAKAPRQFWAHGRPAPIGRVGGPSPYSRDASAGMSANEVPVGPRRTFKG